MKFVKKNKYSILRMFLKYSFVIVIFVSILFPIVFVQGAPDTVNINTGIATPLTPEYSDIPSFIEDLLTIVLVLGVPLVALAIIYSGFLFVQASGSSEKLGTAKKALLYSVIGAALLLGAWVLAEAIKTTVDDIKSTT